MNLNNEPEKIKHIAKETTQTKFSSSYVPINTHAAVSQLSNLGRHLVSARNYRYFRHRAFASWGKAMAMEWIS